ncbi:hypothetical protein BO78DRAFT_110164 [Aspergillus sclerotiicarbonarius CBS 121057]|uniref:Uncharacterized protein n=1 Tax=Aspergillus sclerotiicarbonarius (strain CBS 121057 / IBT 28362) TaxID=1448318 RepID=A0A319E9C2_ASPSB|nr:hypothetical protein BO78DRAFT_110164 [Aspergillus sclerotiicarbonarius CBS 121057]
MVVDDFALTLLKYYLSFTICPAFSLSRAHSGTDQLKLDYFLHFPLSTLQWTCCIWSFSSIIFSFISSHPIFYFTTVSLFPYFYITLSHGT